MLILGEDEEFVWVTATVLVKPPPAMVTVAVLSEPVLFSLFAVTVTVPFAVPLVGLTVNQSASSLTVQLIFELIVKLALEPEAEPNVRLVGDTVNASGSDIVK